MTEQRPGDHNPPAVTPDPTLVESDEGRDATLVESDDGQTVDARTIDAQTIDAQTVEARARWSGAAAVPPPAPKKAWWSRRRSEPPAPAETVDWAAVPAVDPWADEDTPIDPFPAVLDLPETQLPPTRLESPPPAPAPPAAPAPALSKKQPALSRKQPPAPSREQPPALSKKERKAIERKAAEQRAAAQRSMTRPALPEPPPWVPREVRRPLPAPPRKRRRWGRRFALFSLASLLCCCGGPVAWFQFPAARQYPVSADLPKSFGDLTRRDDRASTRVADRLAEELRAANARADGVFHGVYVDGRGKRVTVFGVTGWRFTPAGDVRAQLDRLADDFRLSGVQSYDLGEFGAHESCGVGRQGGTSVVVCAWADHGSLAAVLLTRRSLDDSADLVGRLRSTVLSPG